MAVHKLPRMADVNDKRRGWCFMFKRPIGVAREKPGRTGGLEMIMAAMKRSANGKHLFKSANDSYHVEKFSENVPTANVDKQRSYAPCVF